MLVPHHRLAQKSDHRVSKKPGVSRHWLRAALIRILPTERAPKTDSMNQRRGGCDGKARYFAIVWPASRAVEAAVLSGYERDGKVLRGKNLLGFALDYYPDEERRYRREFGKAIIGNFPTRELAEAGVVAAMEVTS
jgi:hypothetical protein